MSRTTVPFSVQDISALARALRGQLGGCDHTPSHLEMLNLLARAAGHRNFQSLRAQAEAQGQLQRAAEAAPPADFVLVKRAAGHFDAQGRLKSWPAKASLQEPCLWVIWSKLPPREPLTESALSARIRAAHLFGDHALLRRELCDRGLVKRTADGREYRRVERRPPADAIALIHHLGDGAAAAQPARSGNGRAR
jgi:hypothetical protein